MKQATGVRVPPIPGVLGGPIRNGVLQSDTRTKFESRMTIAPSFREKLFLTRRNRVTWLGFKVVPDRVDGLLVLRGGGANWTSEVLAKS